MEGDFLDNIIDNTLQFGPEFCQRCGMLKSQHKLIIDGKKFYTCIRKKPYKFADGTDVKLGMQAWHFHPFSDDLKIITGMVRFICKNGTIGLLKYPEERAMKKITCENGVVLEIPINFMHEPCFTAHFSCFSSLKNAEAAVEKKKKEKEEQNKRWDRYQKEEKCRLMDKI